ncbi:MAG: NHL repeat-containing protein [Planctomycetota bacterium]
MTCASWLLIASLAQTHLGEPLGTIDALARPVAATFGPAGTVENALWVAESGSGAVGAGLRALGGIDVSFTGRSAGKTVARAGLGVLISPTGVAVDGEGAVYATDDVLHAVWRFLPDGTQEQLARKGSGPGEVYDPCDVEVWPRHNGPAQFLAVADRGNRRAQVLDLASGQWLELKRPMKRSEPFAVGFAPGALDRNGDAGPGGILIADGARNQVDRFTSGGSYRDSFSDWGYFPSLVSAPSALAFADRHIFVADTDNHRVQAFDLERPGDPTDGLRYRFGVHAIRPGEGDGSLHYPVDIAIDRDAVLIAVVEPLDDRVQIFGRGQGAAPKADPTRAGLGAPAAHFGPRIAASGQYLVTLSPESHRAQAHDLRGEQPIKISELFGFGERLGMLRTPVGVYLGSEGTDLLITDRGNRRLTRASLDVTPDQPIEQNPELETVLDALDLESFGIDPGDVTRVHAAGQEGPGLIAIVDHASDKVALFNDGLELVGRIGGSDADPIVGISGVAATPGGTLLVLDRFGAGSPEGSDESADPKGVADARGGRVLELSLEGEVLSSFGGGTLVDPAAVVAHGDRAWVADAARDRIEIYRRQPSGAGEPPGAYESIGGFGRFGLGRAEFHEPRGLAITGDERLVVLDFGHHRGQIFDLEGNFLDGFGGRLYTAPLRAAGARRK